MSVKSYLESPRGSLSGISPTPRESRTIDEGEFVVAREIPADAVFHAFPNPPFSNALQGRRTIRESFLLGSFGTACALLFLLVWCFRRTKGEMDKKRTRLRRLAESNLDDLFGECREATGNDSLATSRAQSKELETEFEGMKRMLKGLISKSERYGEYLQQKRDLLVFQVAQKDFLQSLLTYMKEQGMSFSGAAAHYQEEEEEEDDDDDGLVELPPTVAQRYQDFKSAEAKARVPIPALRLKSLKSPSTESQALEKIRETSGLRSRPAEGFIDNIKRPPLPDCSQGEVSESSSESEGEEGYNPMLESLKRAIFSESIFPSLAKMPLGALSVEMLQMAYESMQGFPRVSPFVERLRVVVGQVLRYDQQTELSGGATRHRLCVCMRIINSTVIMSNMGFKSLVLEAIKPLAMTLPQPPEGTGRRSSHRKLMFEFLKRMLTGYVGMTEDELTEEYLSSFSNIWTCELTKVMILMTVSARPLTLRAHVALVPRDQKLLKLEPEVYNEDIYP